MVIQWTQLTFFYKTMCLYNSSLHVSIQKVYHQAKTTKECKGNAVDYYFLETDLFLIKYFVFALGKAT